ncbi:MAG: ABC transporter permease subunit, partial [Vulcanimicrobiaceae bacterium]
MFALLAQHLVDGIVSGAILALPALGLALIWRIAGFPHLAHGSLITIGAYVAWAALTQANILFPIAILLALIAVALLGIGMHKGIYSRLAGQPMFSLFLASIGIELFLRYGTILTFGADFRTFPFPPQRGIRMGIVTITPN